jgi:hypothetical protein
MATVKNRQTETSALFPSSRWMMYSAAAERLGLTPGLVAARARRRRWRTRTRSDTGEAEVEVPAVLLNFDSAEKLNSNPTCHFESGLPKLWLR